MSTSLDPRDEASVQMICWIARQWARDGTNSFSKLADASEYHFKKDRIGEGEIEAELRRDTSLIVDWIRWSEDKRCSPAYYFKQDGNEYVVGYFHEDKNKRIEERFDDPAIACARFIIAELNDS